MTPDQIELLRDLSQIECLTSEDPDMIVLRDLGYAYVWDMWPGGERRWAVTPEGRAFIADNYEPPDPPGWEGGFADNH